jgi:aspartate/glutamate racemase
MLLRPQETIDETLKCWGLSKPRVVRTLESSISRNNITHCLTGPSEISTGMSDTHPQTWSEEYIHVLPVSNTSNNEIMTPLSTVKVDTPNSDRAATEVQRNNLNVDIVQTVTPSVPVYGILGGMGPTATAISAFNFCVNMVADTDQDALSYIAMSFATQLPDRTEIVIGMKKILSHMHSPPSTQNVAREHSKHLLNYLFDHDLSSSKDHESFVNHLRKKCPSIHLHAGWKEPQQRECDKGTLEKWKLLIRNVNNMIDMHVNMGVTVLSFPCNTFHSDVIFSQIQRYTRRKHPDLILLHMVQECCKYIKHSLVSTPSLEEIKVGVLSTKGTHTSAVYADCLYYNGITLVELAGNVDGISMVDLVHDSIYNPEYGLKIKSNPPTTQAVNQLEMAVEYFLQHGVRMIVMGCTEIPSAFNAQKARVRYNSKGQRVFFY